MADIYEIHGSGEPMEPEDDTAQRELFEKILTEAAVGLRESRSYLDSLDTILRRAYEAYLVNPDEDEGKDDEVVESNFDYPLIQRMIRRLLPTARRVLVSRGVEYAPTSAVETQLAQIASEYVNDVLAKQPMWAATLMAATEDACVFGLGAARVETNRRDDDSDPSRPQEPPVSLRHILRGNFLYYPGTLDIETSPFIAERRVTSRAELLQAGFPPEIVMALATAHGRESNRWSGYQQQFVLSNKWIGAQESTATESGSGMKLGELVEIHECWVRCGDRGELYHLVLGDKGGEGDGLDNYPEAEGKAVIDGPYLVDRVPIIAFYIRRNSGMMEGQGIPDILTGIQRGMTRMARAIDINVSDVGHPRLTLDLAALKEPDVDTIRENRRTPIFVKSGQDVRQAVQYSEAPFVSDKLQLIFAMWEKMARDVSGISDASGGLTEEALANMSATQAAIINEAGGAQTEDYIRELAVSVEAVYREVLKQLVEAGVQHSIVREGQDVVYSSNEWSPWWEANMDSSMATGSRGSDVAALTQMISEIGQMVATFGPDNPMQGITELRAAIRAKNEALGFSASNGFLAQISDEKLTEWVQGKLQEASQQAEQQAQQMQQAEQVKEQAKADAAMQIAAFKARTDAQVEAMRAESRAAVEQAKNAAQAEGDRIASAAKMESDQRIAAFEARMEQQSLRVKALVEAELAKALEAMKTERELILQSREHEHEAEMANKETDK